MKHKTFKEYKTQDLVAVETNIKKYWLEKNIFEKSIISRSKNKSYVFYEGPPSANGLPGIHHVMGRTIKDLFCRFHTLLGKQVLRKGGWDTHGLPIELHVEKELGITKEDIGKTIDIETYNQHCKKTVMQYTDVWSTLTQDMGYWVDMSNPYITYHNKYIESVWWLLGEIYKKKYLYKGYSIQPYSPMAGTGLSSHELNQPGCYKEITDTSIIAQFKIKNPQNIELFRDILGEIFFLAWTTTPWTLPANTALTINKKEFYLFVETYNRYTFRPIVIIFAKKLINKVLATPYKACDNLVYEPESNFIPYRIIKECLGQELLGLKYEPLMDFVEPYENVEKAFVVIHGEHVTTEDGTGIVHTAPTFGVDDYKMALEQNIPPMLIQDELGNIVPIVDKQGRFVEAITPWKGLFVREEYNSKPSDKAVDIQIAIYLKEKNRAFRVEKYKHSYPHCWRTDKPILYYPLDSWFIKTTAIKDRLVALNQTINWKPESTGINRFGKWLENCNDWNLSRSRFWGIPLPIWRTENQEEEIFIYSIENLKKEIEKSISFGFMASNFLDKFKEGDFSKENYKHFDLHKHEVDKIILCSSSGKPMYREADLLDVWFDSGAMPYAQWHYPFENKELIDSGEFFPADFIAEGVDQTRGWFFTLHVLSTLIFDKVAFKNVVSNGLVLDKNGQKMSKRLGNSIDPFEILKTYGSDVIRWYMISNASPWDNLRFDINGLDEVRRKFFGTLYNTYAFFALYANIDGFDPNKTDFIPPLERLEMDRWLLSELTNLNIQVKYYFSSYEPTKAARAIQKFVLEDMSNWFVRLNRRRFWKQIVVKEKIAAYWTLYECLRELSIMLSPIAPFYADQLYLDLTSNLEKESVHLEFWPKADEKLLDKNLNYKNQLIQKLCSMVLALRKKEIIKVRQPLQKIMIACIDEALKKAVEESMDILKAEVNVKEVILLDGDSTFLIKELKPNFKVLGPKYGPQLKTIQLYLASLSQEAIKCFEETKTLSIPKSDITLTHLDVEIQTKDIEGWLVLTEGIYTVALDITISPELKQEGMARDLINKIQQLRKIKDFYVTDTINLSLPKLNWLEDILNIHKTYICQETLTENIFWQTKPLEDTISIGNTEINININKN